MDWVHGASWTMHAAVGVGLAASAGLRAFLPLLVVATAGRLGWVPLSSDFEWLAGTPALIVFGTAVVIELLADKIPVLDHLLDVVAAAVKPLAGALLMATFVADLTPLWATVSLILAGGATAGAVHVTKAHARLASTVTTGGLANPLLSIVEDAVALFGSIASLVIPLIAVVTTFLVVALGAFLLLRLRPRAQSAP